MEKVCYMCLRQFETETPSQGMQSCSKEDCLSIYEAREAERKAEAERKRSALFMKAGNQSYGSIPWARK